MQMTEFILQHRLCGDDEALATCMRTMEDELAAGLAGRPSSLKMLPSYLQVAAQPVQSSAPVLAVDIGGSNLRWALAQSDAAGAWHLEQVQRCPLPGSDRQIDISAFYQGLASAIAPVVAQVERIGLAFSFPCEILPDHEGRILSFSKELHITNTSGSLLAAGLRAALNDIGYPCRQRITVLNDAVAVLLAAWSQSEQAYASYIGFVLGTGLNASYLEDNSQIHKDRSVCGRPGRTIINTEAAGFNQLPLSSIDRAFDAVSSQPGTQQLEKLLSGAYLGPLLHCYVVAAAQAGCFSPQLCTRLSVLDALYTKHITQFSYGAGPLAQLAAVSSKDGQALELLVDAFLERSAMLAAALLTALIKRSCPQWREAVAAPCCISANGSTFAHCLPLQEKIKHKLHGFATAQLGFPAVWLHLPEATLLGAAVAGATAGR